jgi:hypothetical protein
MPSPLAGHAVRRLVTEAHCNKPTPPPDARSVEPPPSRRPILRAAISHEARSYLVSDFLYCGRRGTAGFRDRASGGGVGGLRAIQRRFGGWHGFHETMTCLSEKISHGILPRGGSSAFPASSHLVPRRHTPMLSGRKRICRSFAETWTKLLSLLAVPCTLSRVTPPLPFPRSEARTIVRCLYGRAPRGGTPDAPRT